MNIPIHIAITGNFYQLSYSQYIHVPIDIAMNIPVNIAIHIVITYYKVGLSFIGCE